MKKHAPDPKFAFLRLVEDDVSQRNGWYWFDEEKPEGGTGPFAKAQLAMKDAKRKGFIVKVIKP